MNDIKKYLNKDFVLTLSLYFTLIFLIINLGIFLLNLNYKNYSQVQKNEAFKKIVEHMIIYNDTEVLSDYIEHYSHIHNTSIKLYYNDELMYSTSLEGTNYKEYQLIIDDEVVGNVLVDDTYSPNTILNSTFLLVINIFIIVFYLVSILLFYTYSKRKVKVLIDDINKIKKNFNSIEDSHLYSFTAFQEVSDRLTELNRNYKELSLQKSAELRTVTHDMKTPLTILLSYVEGIENNRIKVNDEIINTLKEEINALNQLIESINRSESNVEFKLVDLSKLLIEQVERFSQVFKTKGINVTLDIDEGISIYGEIGSLSRVVYNLLSNCFYYTKENGQVFVGLKQDDEVVELSVKDNGTGIPKKELKNIFYKSYRVKDTKSLHKKGSGLGLYIVDLLVKELNGRIDVTSELGKGTTFKVFFKKGVANK